MLLSAFVCPGAGQFMQRRRVAGLVFCAGFLAAFIWLMLIAGKIILDFYRMAFDFDYAPATPNLIGILPPLAIAMAFYVVNLVDVLLAQLRIARAGREQPPSIAP